MRWDQTRLRGQAGLVGERGTGWAGMWELREDQTRLIGLPGLVGGSGEVFSYIGS